MKKLIIALMAALAIGAYAQDRGLAVVAKKLGGDYAAIGRQVALFIAIDDYEEWMPLKHPVQDARELKAILERRYWIDESIELYDKDATKAGILKTLDGLSSRLGPDDSLFIYYAGHGQLDKLTDTGFWIPVNGGTDKYEQKNWIANIQIRNLLARMKARHVVLVSDSCFSGDLLDPTRGAMPDIDEAYFKNAFGRSSRQILSSGASETVPDASQFSYQLKRALEANARPYIDPVMLYSEIRLGVRESTPLYGEIKDSGQQAGGSFLFFLRAGAAASEAAAAPPAAQEPQGGNELPAAEQGASLAKAEPAAAQQKSKENYSGLGIVVTKVGEDLFVSWVFPDGPAGRAGIKPGEVVAEIDGRPTKDMSASQFSERVRGSSGSDIALKIKPYRYLLPLPRTLTLVREPIVPTAFQARSQEGDVFQATVQGRAFFGQGDEAPEMKDRVYAVEFPKDGKLKFIDFQLSLAVPPSDHERTLPYAVKWTGEQETRSYDKSLRIQPGWTNVTFWSGFSGKGRMRVEIYFDGRLVADGAYIWN